METWLPSKLIGEPGFQPKPFYIQIAQFVFASFGFFFFQIFIFIITSKIIQTLQKGIKGLLLPHPTPATPLPQACTANCLVGVLAGHLLCMHRSPKGARHAYLQ